MILTNYKPLIKSYSYNLIINIILSYFQSYKKEYLDKYNIELTSNGNELSSFNCYKNC